MYQPSPGAVLNLQESTFATVFFPLDFPPSITPRGQNQPLAQSPTMGQDRLNTQVSVQDKDLRSKTLERKSPKNNQRELWCIFEYANQLCFLSIGTGPAVDGSSTAALCQRTVPRRKTLIGFTGAYCRTQKLPE